MDWLLTTGFWPLAICCATAGSLTGSARAMRTGLLLAGLLFAFGSIWPAVQPLPLALGILLALVNALALLRISAGRKALSAEEALFHDRHLARLKPADVRLFVGQGSYVPAKAGEQLTRSGDRVDTLYFLIEGSAAVVVDGAVVGRVGPGDLIGEAALLPGGVASADVKIVEDGARLWFIARDRLDQFLRAQPQVAAELRAATLAAMQAKLEAANRR